MINKKKENLFDKLDKAVDGYLEGGSKDQDVIDAAIAVSSYLRAFPHPHHATEYLKSSDFSPNTMAASLNLSGIVKGSPLHTLVERLNGNRHEYCARIDGSIMGYEQLCTCDTAYLCEHRIQWIIDFVKDH